MKPWSAGLSMLVKPVAMLLSKRRVKPARTSIGFESLLPVNLVKPAHIGATPSTDVSPGVIGA
jgi:hypothetical protein